MSFRALAERYVEMCEDTFFDMEDMSPEGKALYDDCKAALAAQSAERFHILCLERLEMDGESEVLPIVVSEKLACDPRLVAMLLDLTLKGDDEARIVGPFDVADLQHVEG